MSFVDGIGYLAALFGTSIMLPQLIKTIKTRKAEDLSLVMLIVYLINCSLWFWYGMLIQSKPVIFCNIIAFLIGAIQTWLKIKFK